MGAFRTVLKVSGILWLVYILGSVQIERSNRRALGSLFRGSAPTSINLVIAHPDDEVMFFAPTLLQIDEWLPGSIEVNVISLTDGGADGLGDLRTKELQDCVRLLLRKRKASVEVLDFLDGMDVEWDLERAVKALQERIVDESPLFLTFDENGISGHVNHISCYKAVQKVRKHYSKSSCFKLVSKKYLFEKYSGFMPALFHSFISSSPSTLINSFRQYLLALSSMMNAHVSQMVWFRYGWWLFSYYVYANELQAF